MILEFELKQVGTTADKSVVYEVRRKGLRVGILALDKEPYALREAKIKTMRCE